MFGTKPHHSVDAGIRQSPCCVDHMAQHGLAGQRVQNLGKIRIHARAFTGSEDHDMGLGHGQDFLLWRKRVTKDSKKNGSLSCHFC